MRKKVVGVTFKPGDVVRIKDELLSKMKEAWKSTPKNLALWCSDLVVRSVGSDSCTFFYTPECEAYSKNYPDRSYFHISSHELELVEPADTDKAKVVAYQANVKARMLLKAELSDQLAALLQRAHGQGFNLRASWHGEYGGPECISWPFSIEVLD